MKGLDEWNQTNAILSPLHQGTIRSVLLENGVKPPFAFINEIGKGGRNDLQRSTYCRPDDPIGPADKADRPAQGTGQSKVKANPITF
jgi:hypothetical protein